VYFVQHDTHEISYSSSFLKYCMYYYRVSHFPTNPHTVSGCYRWAVWQLLSYRHIPLIGQWVRHHPIPELQVHVLFKSPQYNSRLRLLTLIELVHQYRVRPSTVYIVDNIRSRERYNSLPSDSQTLCPCVWHAYSYIFCQVVDCHDVLAGLAVIQLQALLRHGDR
jgi:hypothetical protein